METKKGNIPQSLVIILIILNFLVLGAFGFWFYQEKIIKGLQFSQIPLKTPDDVSTTTTAEPTILPIQKPTVSPKAKTDIELLKEAFAEKYSKLASDINVTISKNTGTYANGGVKFADEIGGGWWLAYNDGVRWIIVADGNGTVPCEAIDPYNFPVDMVPECFRESDGSLIKRS